LKLTFAVFTGVFFTAMLQYLNNGWNDIELFGYFIADVLFYTSA
jgi:nucleoside recognition membrane protein YjiH